MVASALAAPGPGGFDRYGGLGWVMEELVQLANETEALRGGLTRRRWQERIDAALSIRWS